MEDEHTGYLHNISPLKKGSKTTWFDMQIQTEAEVVRGVCLSAAKHNDFKKYSEQKLAPSKSRNSTLMQQEIQRVY